MSSLALRLARPELLALPPFDIGTRDTGTGDIISLDANENPFPPLSSSALDAGINRYPEPQPVRLCRIMSSLYGVAPDQLVVTRGADDAIDLLVRAFCRAGEDAILVAAPTFSAYAHFAHLQGARVANAQLTKDFDLDTGAFLEAARAEPALKLAFICSPNNPTGNPVPPAQLLEIAEALPNTIIVVDEAYIEFSELRSLAEEAAKRANLVVLRTLSKAYGLAGARIGAAISNAEMIGVLRRALPPYPLPTLSIEAALVALAPARRAVHQDRIDRIKAERARMADRLAASPLVRTVRNGGGNFLFLEVEDAPALARRFDQLGIRVRFRETAAAGGVRLTIGTPEENEAVLAALGVGITCVEGRRAEVARDTRETSIAVAVDLDRSAPRRIATGIPFYDHMLDQVAAHGGFSLILSCDGDLDIDGHHSIEDCAIAFGSALARALGKRQGIGRFGFALPMDEADAHVLIDLSGRPCGVFEGRFEASHIGNYPTEMTSHVFRSLAESLGAAIHVRVSGQNDHHKTEACFKAFGRALRQAIRVEGGDVPSTKGML
ncbi:MAG: histidinol-phosphate transaminase [Sphingosinicella sp.]|nr:histidinol-phosphate transaminase [Sphingosinicella sp.]